MAMLEAVLPRGGQVMTGMETHRLDQAARRLLLLASRGTWDEAQRAVAQRLVGQVADWDAWCAVVIRSLGACLAYRLLSTLDGVPPPVLERMRQAARASTMNSLRIEAAQLAFMSDCLVPLGVHHVFFKGPALAHRYHAVPSARPGRDVDVLIDPARALDVVRHACQLGYRPKAEMAGERELAAWVKLGAVCAMFAPNGVLIEIHQSLDHGDGILDVGRMLSRAETIEFHGRALPVLRTSDLFVYMCMHHTRHFWSHLHWYADLDALIAHPLFDLDEARDVAAAVGLTPTVEACLRLHDFARTADWPQSLSLDGDPAATLLVRSIDCLEGGLVREYALRSTRLSEDRAFAWQSTPGERARLFVRRIRKQCLRGWNGVVRRLRSGRKAPAAR